MSEHVEKPKDKQILSLPGSVSQQKSNANQCFQFIDNRPESIAQRKSQSDNSGSPAPSGSTQPYTQPLQKKENNTGLPDNLKSGIENLSGHSMNDVKVHYNSDKPAQLQAHAYAQGTDIHLASGQEKHLPHEAWHVVQQKQGRVKPTVQLKSGVPCNDDEGLEKEADVMGAKALASSLSSSSKNSIQAKSIVTGAQTPLPSQTIQNKKLTSSSAITATNNPVQRAGEGDDEETGEEQTTDPFASFFGPVVHSYNVQSNIDRRIGLRTLGLGGSPQRPSVHSTMTSPIVSNYDPHSVRTQSTENTEEERSSPLTITSGTLQALSTNSKALVYLQSFPERYHDLISARFKSVLDADEERALLPNATHLLDAVLENFDSGQWDNLGKVLETYVDARPKSQGVVEAPGLGNTFSNKEFLNAVKKIKVLKKSGNIILDLLVRKKAIRIANPEVSRQNKQTYICLHKLIVMLDDPEQAKVIFQASGANKNMDQYTTELGKLNAFFTGKIYINTDVREKFEELKSKHSASFKDWFHSFASTLNLMSGRSDVPDAMIRKILKYELNKYHLQATYNMEDTLRLGRQTSPLVMEGYARGIKTGMWDLSRKISEDKLKEQFEVAQRTAIKKTKSMDDKFNVFPAPKPFAYNKASPEVFNTVPADINTKKMVYISSLKVQLVKASSKKLKQAEGGKVSSHMGGRGLRSSASESAETVVEEMLSLINAQDLDGALNLVTKLSYDKKDPKKDVIKKLKTVTLNVNTLIAPSGSDPIKETTANSVKRLTASYKHFCTYTNDRLLPFFVLQNVKSVKNLLGSNESYLFSRKIPATISGDLTDAIERSIEIMNVIPFTKDKSKVESFYQQIQNIHHFARFAFDWNGDKTTMHTALTGMLPESSIAPQMTQVSPHGLGMIDHIANSLPQETQDSTALLHGSYYETPHLFNGAETKANVEDPSLREKKLIVMEPHPNNAASSQIQPHDPVKLIKNLFTNSQGPYTVIMDVTLNHLRDAEIEATLNEAKPYILSGKLNLILLQSGTKFFQNGMDLVNIGTAIIFNDGGSWVNFNQKMKQSPAKVPKDDQLYIANMLVKNKETLKQYLDKIKSNTASLRSKIMSKMTAQSAFEVVPNSDKNTVYISFQPNDAYVRTELDIALITPVSVEKRAEVNQVIYFKHLLPAFKHLPSVDRSSFGFNITNFGECFNTVRITPGIENEKLLSEYSNTIVALGNKLFKEQQAKKAKEAREENPQRFRKWRDKRNWQKLLKLGMITQDEAEVIKQEVAVHRENKKQRFLNR